MNVDWGICICKDLMLRFRLMLRINLGFVGYALCPRLLLFGLIQLEMRIRLCC